MLALVVGSDGAQVPAPAGSRLTRVAVFPVDNLTGRPVPGDDIRIALAERVAAAGVEVLPFDALDDFLSKHRVRYAAGIDGPTADALRSEAGVGGAIFASVDAWSDVEPPKIALSTRLVTTDTQPIVAWADDIAIAGDDHPGLLQLTLVTDPGVLLGRALSALGRSLQTFLDTGAPAVARRDDKFRPRVTYRGVTIEPGRQYTVAVLPFYNLTERRSAGQALSLLFTRHLASEPVFRAIDPGEVRQQLLQARIVMDGGISIGDADLVASVLDADFVLAGRIIRYEDYEGDAGLARVDFSAVLIERTTRRVVWSSHSYNDGDDGIRFFDRGRSRTAHVMASQMAAHVTSLMATGRN